MKNKISSKRILKVLLIFTLLISIIIMEYMLIATSVKESIDDIKTPDTIVEINFEKLTEKGLEFSVSINIVNPNNFVINIDEFTLVAITENNKNVGSLTIDGGIVKPKTSTTFKAKGTVSYEAFDAGILTFLMEGDATVKIRDYEKTLSLSTDIQVFIPDIEDFVFHNEAVNIEIPVQFKIRLRGLLIIAGFKAINPSEISLVGENLVCRIYRLDGDKKTLLGEQDMESCEIPPEADVSVTSEILISYRKFLFSAGLKLIPDWVILQIEGDLLIAGTSQVLPISINAYIDLHMIRILDRR